MTVNHFYRGNETECARAEYFRKYRIKDTNSCQNLKQIQLIIINNCQKNVQNDHEGLSIIVSFFHKFLHVLSSTM